jgi:phosphatidylglycerophosphate synthase
VLWQAFTMAAYVRGAGEGALDAHAGGAAFVHIGQLAIVIGALVAYWGNWRQVGYAIGFLIVSLAQLAFLGDPDKQGDWINGLHGLLAIVLLLAGVLYAQKAWRELRPTASPGAAGSV